MRQQETAAHRRTLQLVMVRTASQPTGLGVARRARHRLFLTLLHLARERLQPRHVP